jgi:hypothetical protein
MRMSLDGGAFIDSKDRDSRTPLSHATMSGHKDVVNLLLDRGADQRLADEAGDTPKQLTKLKGHTNIVGEIPIYSKSQKGKRSSTLSLIKAFLSENGQPAPRPPSQKPSFPRQAVVAKGKIKAIIDPVNSLSLDSDHLTSKINDSEAAQHSQEPYPN